MWIGSINCGCGSSRDSDGKCHVVTVAGPFAADCAAHGIIFSFRPSEAAGEVRAYYHIGETGLPRIVVYSGECLCHPGAYISHEYMVYGCVAKFRTECPCLCQCGVSALFKPVAPRRGVGIGGHAVCVVYISVAGEHCGHCFTSQQTVIKMLIIRLHSLVECFGYSSLFPFRHDPCIQRHSEGCLCAVGICA